MQKKKDDISGCKLFVLIIFNADNAPNKYDPPSPKKIWAFGKKDDITAQINLEQNNGKYTFSFPINDIHYSTSLIDKSKLRDYIEYIIGEIH